MRVFWIVVCVLAVAAAVLAFRPHGSDAERASGGEAEVAIARDDDKGTAAQAPTPPTPATNSPSASPQPAHAAPSKSQEARDAEALVNDLTESAQAASDEDAGDSINDALATGGGSSTSADAAFDPAHPVDNKHIFAGTGTKDDPFVISWDLLLLASQTYVPREGRTDIPPQVKAMDGAHVSIEGYFAFPLASTDSREVLFMLNQWDGCCIGVPPSPYDAIEVRLKEPMGDGRKQYVSYGTLTGTLKVDPYVQDGWLLGIYVMPDGVIDAGL